MNPEGIRGSNTGVFVGMHSMESIKSEQNRSLKEVSGYSLLGAGLCMMANRLSFAFDFKGMSSRNLFGRWNPKEHQ